MPFYRFYERSPFSCTDPSRSKDDDDRGVVLRTVCDAELRGLCGLRLAPS